MVAIRAIAPDVTNNEKGPAKVLACVQEREPEKVSGTTCPLCFPEKPGKGVASMLSTILYPISFGVLVASSLLALIANNKMKRVLKIAMVFCFVDALTVMAQEADTAPSGVEKSTTPSDKMQRAWLWREGTEFTGTTLVFTNDKKIEIKPSKEKLHIYSKKYGSNWVNPSGFFGFKSNASANIFTAIHAIPQGPAGEDYSGVTFMFKNLKVNGSEMTGTCSYSITYGFKGDRQAKELKGDKVPVKFISSDLTTITSNPVKSGAVNNNSAEAEWDQIRKECKTLEDSNNKKSELAANEGKAPELESKASLLLNGKEISFDIFRGGDNAYTDSGKKRINLPDLGVIFNGVDGLAGYPDAITRGANEIGIIILDGLDGAIDGKCMSPDGRRISQLEAEALSDNFSYEMAQFQLEPNKYKYPFSDYLPKDPEKRQAILDVCPDVPSSRASQPNFQKEMRYYDKRSKLLMQANKLVERGENKAAYDLLKKNGYDQYACKVPASAEFFAQKSNSSPTPNK